MGVSVFIRVQEGYHGEPAITQERKHFSKIHPSDCKPLTCLACSYLNRRKEVSAALTSAVDRMNERTNDKTTTVTLRPRVNYNAIKMAASLNVSISNAAIQRTATDGVQRLGYKEEQLKVKTEVICVMTFS